MGATSVSTVLLGAKPANESTMAANLRRAGCVVLGETALAEWQNFRYGKQPTLSGAASALVPSSRTCRHLGAVQVP